MEVHTDRQLLHVQQYVVFSYDDYKSHHKSRELVLHIFSIHFPLNSFEMSLLQNLSNIE